MVKPSAARLMVCSSPSSKEISALLLPQPHLCCKSQLQYRAGLGDFLLTQPLRTVITFASIDVDGKAVGSGAGGGKLAGQAVLAAR